VRLLMTASPPLSLSRCRSGQGASRPGAWRLLLPMMTTKSRDPPPGLWGAGGTKLQMGKAARWGLGRSWTLATYGGSHRVAT
jgi:hypothetical protein